MVCRMVPVMTAVALLVGAAALGAAEKAEVGAAAPNFKATGIDGKEYTLDSFKDAKVVVVCFTCNQCPVAVAYEDRFIQFNKQYSDKGVKFVAINVNTTEDLKEMKSRAEEKGFNFPYAYDATGNAARAYGAQVTPHLYVLDENRKVVYIGSFDDKQNNPTRKYLDDAVNAALQGQKPEVTLTKAFGCAIRPAPAAN